MKSVFVTTVTAEEVLRSLFDTLDSIGLGRVGEEVVKVSEALGRITARPVFARYSSPFYHSAAMDGYAVRFSDTFTASEKSPCLLRLGQDAVYVDTGDPMPEGFNAVIMVEDVNVVGDSIETYHSVTPYQHVRPIGEDIVATELIAPENHMIRHIDAGAMLASGHLDVTVRRRPKIAVIPTGSEIIEPELVRERPPVAPEIIEYNSAVLEGLAKELGAETVRYGIVRDDMEEIKKKLLESVGSSDCVIVNAGSGRGSEDFTAVAIADLGKVLVNGVSIKPGKPVIIGIVEGVPVFGIPGYPVSAFITFQLFVRPLVFRFLGLPAPAPERVRALLSRQVSSTLGVDEFIRVKVGVVGDKVIATPVGRGAGLLMSLVRADGIGVIPSSSEGLQAGTEIEVELLRSREDIGNTIVCIGSHDNTLDVLANVVKKRFPRYSLSSAHVGSMGGLMAIKRGEAHIAGTHLLDEQSGEYNVSYVKRVLGNRHVVLVNLVHREQGLLVKRGNPKGIRGFADLVRDDVIFINRQGGSGTRLLLDKGLRDLGINPALVKGYDREEYTHMSVASAVLTGLADTGLAVDSSAKALDLDFIPVAQERYDLAIPAEHLEDGMVKALLDIVRHDKEFRAAVEALGGYDTSDMGRVMYEQ